MRAWSRDKVFPATTDILPTCLINATCAGKEVVRIEGF
jgi:hypothetical protein